MKRSLLEKLTDRCIRGSIERLVPRQAPQGRIERTSIMHYVFEFAAKSEIDGAYMEFGCFQGSSFIHAFRAYDYWLKQIQISLGGRTPVITRQTMYAFDSFEGLPELDKTDEMDGYGMFWGNQYSFGEQSFLTRLKENGVDTNQVKTVKGFYDQVLTDSLKAELNLPKALIVHIDCDLYSSAVPVLKFIEDRIQDGTLILFDDFYCYRGHPDKGVRGAFNHWLADNPQIIATPYLPYHWAGMSFILNRRSVEG